MTTRRGSGIAASWYPTGLSGGNDPGQAIVKLKNDGSVDVLVGAVDVGEGARTVLMMLAAEELGVDLDKVSISMVDTDTSPYDAGTFASRITHQTGNAVVEAAREARTQLLEVAGRMLGTNPAHLSVDDGKVSSRDAAEDGLSFEEVVTHATFVERTMIVGHGAFGWPPATVDAETGAGDALHNFAYGATFAEVEVDGETGVVEILRLVSAYDCGRAINPLMLEGQIDGGSAMGVGSALLEELHPRYPSLEYLPQDFFGYLIPTVKDVPPLESVIVEVPSESGPWGAKGIAEMTANTQTPAIVNAIHDAVGVWITDVPATPEKVLRAIDDRESSREGLR
jgi:CO/xanthine dehydrogenase Mo-binding subunit